MKFSFTENALKEFQKLDQDIQLRFMKKIHYWQKSKNPLEYAKPLKGHPNAYRFRVSQWRMIVILFVNRKMLKIVKTGHRSDIYNNF